MILNLSLYFSLFYPTHTYANALNHFADGRTFLPTDKVLQTVSENWGCHTPVWIRPWVSQWCKDYLYFKNDKTHQNKIFIISTTFIYLCVKFLTHMSNVTKVMIVRGMMVQTWLYKMTDKFCIVSYKWTLLYNRL